LFGTSDGPPFMTHVVIDVISKVK